MNDRSSYPHVFYQRLTPEMLLVLVPLVIFAIASSEIAQPSPQPLLLIFAKGLAIVTGAALVGALLAAYVLLLLSFRHPLITIWPDGLSVARFYLPWSDVESIHLQKYWGRPRIFATMREPEAFLATLPGYAARFIRNRLRVTGGILIPSVRGYSDMELSVLLEQLRKQRNPREENYTDLPRPAYRKWPPQEIAAAFAISTFGAFFAPRWFTLMDCVKLGNSSCVIASLKWALIVGVGAYMVFVALLKGMERLFPSIDVVEKLSGF